jgi:phosphatidylglycerophosphatase A
MTNPKTDSSPEPAVASGSPAISSSPRPRKPYLSLFIATAGGLGYFTKAPGTFGSFAGVVIAYIMSHFYRVVVLVLFFGLHERGDAAAFGIDGPRMFGGYRFDPNFFASAFVFFVIALIGVWTSGRVEKYYGAKDPQFVVIDEVSGQHLTLLLGGLLPLVGWFGASSHTAWSAILWPRHPNWIILLAGLILFRVFDIWKPFPVRQAESLPGGWGIMADDWMAGIYAGIILWFARMAGF